MTKDVSVETVKLILSDPKAIEIFNKIPKERRNEVLEKYIILGDMVVTHASISSSKETIDEFFSPLRSDIDMIREQLKLIVPTIATPVSKGGVTQETIYRDLESHFLDDSFEDVSVIGKFTDIRSTDSNSKTEILIEVKDYKTKVPTQEIDKFWRDMERRNVQHGIFISMRSGITKVSCPIKLETRMNRTAIYVVNNELNWNGHIFAYYILKKVIDIQSKRRSELKGKDLKKTITKVNQHLLDIQKHNKTIDDILDATDKLRTSSKNKLDLITDLANNYKRKVNEKINDAFEEIEKIGDTE
jgi:hypothetical protein